MMDYNIPVPCISVYRNRRRSASSGDPCAKFPVRPETRRSSSVGAMICGRATRPDFMVSSPTWALAEICDQGSRNQTVKISCFPYKHKQRLNCIECDGTMHVSCLYAPFKMWSRHWFCFCDQPVRQVDAAQQSAIVRIPQFHIVLKTLTSAW